MLFACGSEESEHARLGSATSESGGIERVEDAEESDFWEGMMREVDEKEGARVKRSAGYAEWVQRTRRGRDQC